MIRDATSADLPRLRAIQLAALAEPWDGLLEPAIEGPSVVLVVTEPTGEARADGEAATAATSERPVGYAVALPEGEGAYLAEFAIAAGYRRSGRGSRLMTELCTRLADEGFASLRLTVKLDDDRARSFYDSQGFRVRALVPHHYEDGDGLELVRSL